MDRHPRLGVHGLRAAHGLLHRSSRTGARRPRSPGCCCSCSSPALGLAVYLLFGRDRKAFSRERELARQNLRANAAPLLGPLLARQDAEIDRLEGQSPVRRRLMQLVRRNSHSLLTTQHRVEIQQDAAAHYASLIEDLKGAERSIHLQYFIWADDPFTRKLKTILVERANAGVEVRLLYDPVGSFFKLSRRYRRELRQGGVHVAPASALWRLHTLSYRNHRKIAVIDGRVGYTGGMNIGQEHLDGGPHAASWRDTQLRIEGEGAAVLQAVFLVDWYNATGQDLSRGITSRCLEGVRDRRRHRSGTRRTTPSCRCRS